MVWKSLTKGIVLAAATASVLALGAVATSTSADAAVCRGRMVGTGVGTGILGQGTTMARRNALADWSSKVAARHGARFANTAKARSVRYDCKEGAILQAQCVVTAVPCR